MDISIIPAEWRLLAPELVILNLFSERLFQVSIIMQERAPEKIINRKLLKLKRVALSFWLVILEMHGKQGRYFWAARAAKSSRIQKFSWMQHPDDQWRLGECYVECFGLWLFQITHRGNRSPCEYAHYQMGRGTWKSWGTVSRGQTKTYRKGLFGTSSSPELNVATSSSPSQLSLL